MKQAWPSPQLRRRHMRAHFLGELRGGFNTCIAKLFRPCGKITVTHFITVEHLTCPTCRRIDYDPQWHLEKFFELRTAQHQHCNYSCLILSDYPERPLLHFGCSPLNCFMREMRSNMTYLSSHPTSHSLVGLAIRSFLQMSESISATETTMEKAVREIICMMIQRIDRRYQLNQFNTHSIEMPTWPINSLRYCLFLHVFKRGLFIP